MAFTHRSRRSPHADAAQTTDRPSRDQNSRSGPTGLSCRPWNTSRGRLRGLEAEVEWLALAARAGRRADAHGRGTRSEKSSHRHTTARSSRTSVRLFFPYLKRYQPVTGIRSGPLPLRGDRLHTSYSRCGRYTQYLTRRRPSLRSAQAPRHLEGWVHSPRLLPTLRDAAPGTAPQAEVIV